MPSVERSQVKRSGGKFGWILLAGTLAAFLWAGSGSVLAERWEKVVLTVLIDAEKRPDVNWDRITFWSPAPDVLGTVVFPDGPRNVELHPNTHALEETFYDVRLEKGDSVRVELRDKDFLTTDDPVASGTVAYEGKETVEIRIGAAWITLEFVREKKGP